MAAEIKNLDGSTVVPIGTNNLMDIVAMMRSVADRIESGEIGPFRCAMFVPVAVDSQYPAGVYAWGDIGQLEGVGILAAAQSAVLNPEDDD